MIPRPTDLATSLILQEAGRMTEDSDKAFTEAFCAVERVLAPEHRELLLRLEEAASWHTCDWGDAVFYLALRWAHNPALVLLQGKG